MPNQLLSWGESVEPEAETSVPPTTDDMLDAVAADVANGVKSVTDGQQTTTLESPTERIAAAERLQKNRAARRGFNGMMRVSRAVPPGAGPN